MKKVWMKMGSLFMGIVLAGNLTACSNAHEELASSDTDGILNMEEEALKDVITEQIPVAHSSTDGKEETVYILADANGNTNQVIVSDWLKNGEGNSLITDLTDLKEIENVKGDEAFSQEGENLNWQADGADIYYRGVTDKEVPVEVKLSFMLDGESVTPEEIAGKSGKVTIHLEYINHAAETVLIDGKETEILVPFAMLSGMVLPGDVFSNIEVTNGKIMSEGNNSIVIGVAFPGLKESLQFDKMKERNKDMESIEDIDIPDYMEITADAVNFELGMTLTMAMSDLLSDGNLTEQFSMEEVKDSMDELESAAAELKDGGTALKDGSDAVAEGTQSLVIGVKTLKDGSAALKNGTKELYEKSGQLAEGAGQLKDGTVKLTDGAGKLADGARSLSQGAGQLNTGAATLANGIGTVNSGIQMLQAALNIGIDTEQGKQPAIKDGAGQLAEGAKTLNTMINTYFDTYEKQLNTIVSTLLAQMNTTNASLQTAKANLADAEAERNAAKAAFDQALAGDVQQIETAATVEQDTVSGGNAGVATEISNITVYQPEVLQSAADAYQAAEARAAACQADVSALEAQANEQQEMLAQLQAALHAYNTATGGTMTEEELAQSTSIAAIRLYAANLASGADSLNSGIQSVCEGVAKLANKEQGVPALAAGAKELQNGIGSLNSGANTLAAGANDLKSGAGALASGTTELKDGTTKLVEGSNTLDSGAGELSTGIITLYDGALALDAGVTELADGCLTLKDGLFRFDEEGIQKLASLAGEDTRGFMERLEAVLDAGKEYKTFTKLPEGMDGSVKFIIKTDGVKAEK